MLDSYWFSLVYSSMMRETLRIILFTFVMFTDGWPFNTWGDENYCDTIFLINNPYERNIEAPWGMTVQYED